MPTYCGTAADVSLDCSNLPAAGATDDVYFVAKDDWDAAVNAAKTVVNYTTHKVTALLLDTGDQGYLFQSPIGGTTFTSNLTIQDSGLGGYVHTVSGSGTFSAANALSFKAMTSGRFVVIAGRRGGLADEKWLAFGVKNGLRAEISAYDSSTNSGMVRLTFTSITTPVAEYETEDPLVIDVGTAAQNEAAVVALLTPAA